MWCPHCQSDVPQSADSPECPRRCWRCGRFVAAAERTDADWHAWRGGSDQGLDLTQDSRAPAAIVALSSWDDWTLAAEVRRARRLLSEEAHDAPSRLSRTADLDDDIAQPAGKWTLRGRYLASRVAQSRDRGQYLRVATLVLSSISFAAFSLGIGLLFTSRGYIAAVLPPGIALLGAGIFGLTLCVLMQLLHIRSANHAALDRICLVETRLQNDREIAILAGPTATAAPTGRRGLGTSKQSRAA
jgi:hypothetical protein